MSDIKLCKECWHWIAPKYAERPGKCALGVYENPYADTRACDEYDGKVDDEDYCSGKEDARYDRKSKN